MLQKVSQFDLRSKLFVSADFDFIYRPVIVIEHNLWIQTSDRPCRDLLPDVAGKLAAVNLVSKENLVIVLNDLLYVLSGNSSFHKSAPAILGNMDHL